MKILQVRAKLFYAENGRTDRHDETNSCSFAIFRQRLKSVGDQQNFNSRHPAAL
jgi:hypothetical protein